MSKTYFLSRQAVVSGPYTEDDILALQNTGKLHNYSWIWCSEKKNWDAIDPKPAKAPEIKTESIPEGAYALVGADYIRTEIHNVTPLGYELRCDEPWMNPPVGIGMCLKVFNPGKDEGLDLMKIQNIQRQGPQWVIFLRHQS